MAHFLAAVASPPPSPCGSFPRGPDYYGTAVNVAARIESVCHGGQVAVSQAVYDIVGRSLPDVVWSDHSVAEGVSYHNPPGGE